MKRKKIAIRKKKIVVTLPLEESAPQELYRFGVNVELEAGEHHLGVGIWDEIATSGSFLSLHVVAEVSADEDETSSPSAG